MAEKHFESKIKEVDQLQKPLVVLLKGSGSDSAMMEAIVRTNGLAALREQTTLLVLSASESEAKTLRGIRNALGKASLPPIGDSDLPMVIIIGRQGKALKVLRGLVTAGEVKECLADGVAAFRTSQAQPSDSHLSGERHHEKEAAHAQTAAKHVQGNLEDLGPPSTPAIAPSAFSADPATHQGTAEALVSQGNQEADPEAPLQMQVYLPDGQTVRGTFTDSTSLRQVCSYLKQHSPDGIPPNYKLVSHHLRREFSEDDMSKSLHDLGVASMTSLRLHQMRSPAGAHESALGGVGIISRLLRSAKQLLLSILAQLGFHGNAENRRRQSDEAVPADQRPADSATQTRSQSLRKRHTKPGTVHGIDHSNDTDSKKGPDSNSYWNGNSTQFDGDE